MMNKNVKIAKELVKIAKSHVSTVEDRGGYDWIGWVEEIQPDHLTIYFSYTPYEDSRDDGKWHLSDLNVITDEIKSIDGVKSVSSIQQHASCFGTYIMNVQLVNFGDDISSIVADDIDLILSNNGMNYEND